MSFDKFDASILAEFSCVTSGFHSCGEFSKNQLLVDMLLENLVFLAGLVQV